MQRQTFSAFGLKNSFKISQSFYGKMPSNCYSREENPLLQQSYHLPSFCKQNLRALQKSKHKRVYQNSTISNKFNQNKRRTQLSDRRIQKKYPENPIYPGYGRNRETSQRMKRQKKQNIKSQQKQIKIQEDEIFSFQQLIDPVPKHPPLTQTRRLSINQQVSFVKNDFEAKRQSISSMIETFLNESRSRLRTQKIGKSKPSQKDFAAIKFLGEGKYSKSYLVRQKRTNFICVLKQISKQLIKKCNVNDRVFQQIKIHSFVRHPNIIQLYGFFETETDICLILEYAQEGKLINSTQEQTPQSFISQYAYDMCTILEYLHSNKILYRNIKSCDILLSNGVVKLSDFGWGSQIFLKKSVFCGTLSYDSPQVLQPNRDSQSIDLWRLGVILLQLATARPWINSVLQSFHRKFSHRQIDLPFHLSPDLKNLIQRLLKKDPFERLTLSQVCKHPFLRKYNKF